MSAYIAEKKGRNRYRWFAVGFIFGLLGVVAAFVVRPYKPTASIRIAPKPYIDGPIDRFWYYIDQEKNSQGPMSHHALTQAWMSGSIEPDTFIWHEELANWTPLQDLIKFKAQTERV